MPNENLRFTLVGGPTVLVEFGGIRFLTDPTFDHAGSEYHGRGVTLQKTTDPAVDLSALGRIDAVLLSHDQHEDNLDHAGRVLLGEVPLVLTTKSGAERLGASVRGLSVWESVTMTAADGTETRITATPCRHGPAGIEPIAGDVIGFMLEALDGRCKPVYITGDTVYYEGVAEVARRFSPGHVLAFAGSAQVRGPFNLTMSANDVLDTAHAFADALIIPVHTEGWAHFTQGADELRAIFQTLGRSDRIRTMAPGETAAFA
jgi:L-ascorbate metabolism protein UlaG (beta-lactamase superfamily)